MIPIKPMLTVSGKIFSGKDWIFEPKIDGTRCIAYIRDGTVELQNRRFRPMGSRYPEIIKALTQFMQHFCYFSWARIIRVL